MATIPLIDPHSRHGTGWRHAFSIVAYLITCSASASAQQVVWNNYPSGVGPDAFVSQQDTVDTFHAQTADDFRVRDQRPNAPDQWDVSLADWNGSFLQGDDPAVLEGFNFLFYEDAGGVPPGGPNDPALLAIFNEFVPIDRVTQTQGPLGEHNFDYATYLDFPLLIDTDTRYWLSIQAVLPGAADRTWGIQSSADSYGHEAHQGFLANGIPYWTPVSGQGGAPSDLAFRLRRIPEPGTATFLFPAVWMLLNRQSRFKMNFE